MQTTNLNVEHTYGCTPKGVMMKVDVRGTDNEAFQRALAEFKKKVKKEEILTDLRRHEFYRKPSVRLKLKRIEALKRRRREENDKKRYSKDRS